MQKHFLNVLAFHSFIIEKIVEAFDGEIEDLKVEIETLEDEIDDFNWKIDELESKVKETITLLKEIAKPGEYGSLEQRAWDIYHDLMHLVERV